MVDRVAHEKSVYLGNKVYLLKNPTLETQRIKIIIKSDLVYYVFWNPS